MSRDVATAAIACLSEVKQQRPTVYSWLGQKVWCLLCNVSSRLCIEDPVFSWSVVVLRIGRGCFAR